MCLGFKVCLHDFLPQILYGLQTVPLAPNQIGECVISREQKGMAKLLYSFNHSAFLYFIPTFEYNYFRISSIAAVLRHHEIFLISDNSITSVAVLFMKLIP